MSERESKLIKYPDNYIVHCFLFRSRAHLINCSIDRANMK
jgi:hypothetical protein